MTGLLPRLRKLKRCLSEERPLWRFYCEAQRWDCREDKEGFPGAAGIMYTEGLWSHLSPRGGVLAGNSPVVGKRVNAHDKDTLTLNASLLDFIEKETHKESRAHQFAIAA